MEDYDNAVFNFFCSEENFLDMCKVAFHQPYIKKRLLDEFWQLVQNKLKVKALADEKGYKVKLTGDIKDARTKIMLYKTAWPHYKDQPAVSVAIQRLSANTWPFFGPWINQDNQAAQLDKIRGFAISYMETKKLQNEFEKDDDKWFPFFKALDLDFKTDTEFVKILPVNREMTSNDVAEQVWAFTMEFDSYLDKIVSGAFLFDPNVVL